MRKRAALMILALVVSGGGVWIALALAPACPSGFHPSSATYCVSDATHVAPSSGVRIAFASTPKDPRTGTRIALAIGAMLIGGALVWIALPKRGPEGLIA